MVPTSRDDLLMFLVDKLNVSTFLLLHFGSNIIYFVHLAILCFVTFLLPSQNRDTITVGATKYSICQAIVQLKEIDS